jgi:hypothetical protein
MPRIKKLSFLLPKPTTPANQVISIGNSLVNGLTDNPTVFVTPSPSIADITAGLALLVAANSVPEDEKNNTTRELLQKRKVDFINNFLMPSSYYVLSVANEDRYTASLSGLEMNKEETTAHTPSEFSAIFESVGAAAGTAMLSTP